jgi:uncharacterized sulfatase
VAAAQGETERAAIFGEIFGHDVPEMDNPAAGLRFRWCVEGDWKLIVPTDADASPELYNLADDPHETVDLAAQRGELVERLGAMIDGWWPVEAAAESNAAGAGR